MTLNHPTKNNGAAHIREQPNMDWAEEHQYFSRAISFFRTQWGL